MCVAPLPTSPLSTPPLRPSQGESEAFALAYLRAPDKVGAGEQQRLPPGTPPVWRCEGVETRVGHRSGQTYPGLFVPTALISVGLVKREAGGFCFPEPSSPQGSVVSDPSPSCASVSSCQRAPANLSVSTQVTAGKPRGSSRKMGHKPLPGLSIFPWPQGTGVTRLSHPGRMEPLPSPWKQRSRPPGSQCWRGLPYLLLAGYQASPPPPAPPAPSTPLSPTQIHARRRRGGNTGGTGAVCQGQA